jgi:hypothetical protein
MIRSRNGMGLLRFFWLYTICWGSKTIQKIRHVGSDFFYTWIGPTNKERSHVSIES